MIAKPIISVIVAVLDGERNIRSCLESIFQNNSQEIEIIVIDGGSVDLTLNILTELADQIAYLESGYDSGIADAFNRGIKNAKGEIICVLNSDDRWQHNTADLVTELFAINPWADILYGNVIFVDHLTNSKYIKRANIENIHRRMSVFHPSIFVKRTCYMDVGLYDTSYKLAMDAEWIHRALGQHKKFMHLDSVLSEMSLGGRSDVNFISALKEYYASTVEYGINSKWTALCKLYFFIFFKYLSSFFYIRKLKQMLMDERIG